MSTIETMTGAEAVELAKQMRAAGVQRFVLTTDRFSAVLSPPPPEPVRDVADRIAELTGDERRELLTRAQKEYEEDLYGAVR